MKTELSENIRMLRKKQHITQEKLAEAMGVTVGAVYKWEQDLSTPDLQTVMNLAGFFGISVDALIGYRVQSNAAEACAERILELQQKKEYEQAAAEAERALVLYPNDFRIVFRSGTLYVFKAMESSEMSRKNDADRAIELLRKSELLLSQNRDIKINTFTIRSSIAHCYLLQGKKEQALKLLKENNPGGIHDAHIGSIYAAYPEYPPENAEAYLTNAFQNAISDLLPAMTGYMNYYERMGQTENALEAVSWLIRYLESLLIEGRMSVNHKYLAGAYADSARILNLLGRTEEAERDLRKARTLAEAYDAAPSSQRRDTRFFLASDDGDTIYDDVGASAMDILQQKIKENNWDDAMLKLWEEMDQ